VSIGDAYNGVMPEPAVTSAMPSSPISSAFAYAISDEISGRLPLPFKIACAGKSWSHLQSIAPSLLSREIPSERIRLPSAVGVYFSGWPVAI
jgi:hypothetical protein